MCCESRLCLYRKGFQGIHYSVISEVNSALQENHSLINYFLFRKNIFLSGKMNQYISIKFLGTKVRPLQVSIQLGFSFLVGQEKYKKQKCFNWIHQYTCHLMLYETRYIMYIYLLCNQCWMYYYIVSFLIPAFLK